MKMFRWLVGAMFLMMFSVAHAQGPDDQYVRIYNMIQAGDALSASQPGDALAKYLEAHSELQRFQRLNPDWNTRVVSFRLNYLAAKIAAMSAQAPVPSAPPKPAAPPAIQLQAELDALQEQVRALESDKSLLEAKLKEALSAQPAAVDPRELAKAEEQVKQLQKENDLLKVSLEQARSVPAGDPKLIEQARTDLEEANAKLARQTQLAATLALEKEALQARVQAPSVSDDAAALRAENELLKQRLAESKSAADTSANVNDAMGRARMQIAALQSDNEVLRLEKIALENRVKQLAAGPVATTIVPPPPGPEEAPRVRQLERERDELLRKLEAAQKELYGGRNRSAVARIDDLSNQLTLLRARLEVLEMRPVPYTAEELALFKQPSMALAVSDPRAGKAPAKELPSGAKTLIAEAQRDFSNRQFDRAEEKYLQVLRQDPKNVYTLANLAAIQLELNRLDEADKHIQEALAVAPDDAYSLSILGFLKFRQEKYDDALNALSRAAQLNPQNAEIQNYLGVTLGHKGMRGPAETALRKAIQIEPGYASAHNNLAVIYVSQQPPLVELARWHYQKALAAGHPKNAELEKLLDSRTTAEARP